MDFLKKTWAKFRSWPLWVQIIVALVVLGVVASLGGESDTTTPTATTDAEEQEAEPEDEEPEAEETVEDEVEEEVAAGPGPECIPVPKARIKGMETGLTVKGGSLRMPAYAVKSDDFEKVWMMAVELDAPGLKGDGDIGVWGTNEDPTDTTDFGLTLAANGIAKEFSDWGAAAKPGSAAYINPTDHGVAEAAACVAAAQEQG